jgi:8-oxo-dGTP pyrophosphatase MutT (NUDIX family)
MATTATGSDDYRTQLTMATKTGAARELFEETGIDVRKHLDRLNPAGLRSSPKIDKAHNPILVNEYKHRLFYFLMVTDDDFPIKDGQKAIGSVDLQVRSFLIFPGHTFFDIFIIFL